MMLASPHSTCRLLPYVYSITALFAFCKNFLDKIEKVSKKSTVFLLRAKVRQDIFLSDDFVPKTQYNMKVN